VRIVAGDSRADEVAAAFDATGGKPDIALYGGPVVAAGRVEMLPHVHEQAVCITAHRFGTPNGLSDGLI
jgi:RHH-type proline utilization regulon transcriptional repressor/proline dehydrogenase/delta 1-pyrroline-5-carboxylate dehydrogenase